MLALSAEALKARRNIILITTTTGLTSYYPNVRMLVLLRSTSDLEASVKSSPEAHRSAQKQMMGDMGNSGGKTVKLT